MGNELIVIRCSGSMGPFFRSCHLIVLCFHPLDLDLDVLVHRYLPSSERKTSQLFWFSVLSLKKQ